MKICPFCAESVQDAATRCRFCGSELAPTTPAAAPTAAPTAAPSRPAGAFPSPTGMRTRPRMPRWSAVGIVFLILFTCGFGGLYLSWVQYSAVKQLNPKAMDAGVAILLEIVGALFTAGLLGIWVTYVQTKALVEYGESVAEPTRNTSLMTVMMAGSIIAVLSVWFSWTGITLLLAAAFEIYTLYAFHKELELYTVE